MITRLFAHNFRCLVNFTMEFGPYGVLCGPNGAGKSSVFDALEFIRGLASGDETLENERYAGLDFTNWLDNPVQQFELGVRAQEHDFVYTLHLEQTGVHVKPRVVFEKATCDGRELFSRNLEGVKIPKEKYSPSGFPLDWRQAALGSIQPAGDRREIEILQQQIAGLLILRPSPREMEEESRAENPRPNMHLNNLTSWYRSLAQEQDWTDELRESLRRVWPDFRSFRLFDAGRIAKGLQLRFGDSSDREAGLLYFGQLSDGEKALVALYMVRAALATGAAGTVLIDEPDNFVGLPELQPWAFAMMELLDESRQAILISHNPEILGSAGEDFGQYLWRVDHSSPTRVGPLRVPDGLTAGEAVARGWASA